VTAARDWEHGVFLGSIMASETTAAQAGAVGKVRRDPFAMLPFCGYHMGDYFQHWLEIGARTEADKLPRLFYVNWFRKDADRKFLWPGFGDNSRVLAWVLGMCDGTAEATDTAIGAVPTPAGLELDGLDLSPERLALLLSVDRDEWAAEVPSIAEHYDAFGDHLPSTLREQLADLAARLGA
jgi:phosphoenolpyruvate carboxykinase (GTP)